MAGWEARVNRPGVLCEFTKLVWSLDHMFMKCLDGINANAYYELGTLDTDQPGLIAELFTLADIADSMAATPNEKLP